MGLQTNMGVPLRQAVENAYRLGAQPFAKIPTPRALEKQKVALMSFENLETSTSNVPLLPWKKEPGTLYRGMALSVNGAAMRNILENGLRIEDVGPKSHDLSIIYATATFPRALKDLPKKPVTNLTNNPKTALFYATARRAKGSLMVLVKVSGIAEDKDIVQVAEDIPASQIEEMIACVSWNGTPVWARVKLHENGFELTPYTPITTRKP